VVESVELILNLSIIDYYKYLQFIFNLGNTLKRAIYLPTSQNIIIVQDGEEYCEIFIDGEYKTVSKSDVELVTAEIEIASFNEVQENIFLNCIKKPLSDILYSYNTNRLTPEPHQYKPLIKFLNSENNRILIADEVGL